MMANEISPKCFMTILRVARRQSADEGRHVSIVDVFDALLSDGVIVFADDAFVLASETSETTAQD